MQQKSPPERAGRRANENPRAQCPGVSKSRGAARDQRSELQNFWMRVQASTRFSIEVA